MGNCWSRFRSSEATNPRRHESTSSPPAPMASPLMDPVPTTSGDPVPSPLKDPSRPTTSGDPVPSPLMDPSRPTTSGDPVPLSMDVIGEMYREMYKKINPVELIDSLVSFIENQLRKMNNPSEGGPSSSDDRSATVRDITKLAATTIDTISTEAEKLSESYALKEMGSLMIKVMKGVAELHWAFIGLSVAAFAVESYMSVGSTQNECKELLVNIIEVAKYIKQYGEQNPNKTEEVCKAVGTIVEGAVLCLGYLKKGKFSRI